MPLQCCKDKWPTIPDDEPVFILRGKDKLAIETVNDWLAKAVANGVNDAKIAAVQVHRNAMIQFAKEHHERMQIPD
jgi:hypothetical protein